MGQPHAGAQCTGPHLRGQRATQHPLAHPLHCAAGPATVSCLPVFCGCNNGFYFIGFRFRSDQVIMHRSSVVCLTCQAAASHGFAWNTSLNSHDFWVVRNGSAEISSLSLSLLHFLCLCLCLYLCLSLSVSVCLSVSLAPIALSNRTGPCLNLGRAQRRGLQPSLNRSTAMVALDRRTGGMGQVPGPPPRTTATPYPLARMTLRTRLRGCADGCYRTLRPARPTRPLLSALTTGLPRSGTLAGLH